METSRHPVLIGAQRRARTVDFKNKATKIDLFSMKTIPMRTFHVTWFAFFLCFFGWFGIAPLMAVVREDLGLTQQQVGNTAIASVLVTAPRIERAEPAGYGAV
jgi:hypothetical protein